MLSLDLPQNPSTSAELIYKSHLLIVEDDQLIREMIVLALKEQGYDVTTATDGQQALNLIQETETFPDKNFDLIILDLMLPQVNGLDICRLLRYKGNPIPILIVSAKASETDRVLGLEVGADDYLTKPFSMRELVARCRALLRRNNFSTNPQNPLLQFGDIILAPQECRVTLKGQEVNLSPKEFRLLELFMGYPRRVWSREQLIDKVWGLDFLGDTKTVDVHIRWLREKIEEDPGNPKYIVTVRGFGYRFG